MTDKQIIIDGVPVQDCCYFDYENDGYEDNCYIHQNECSAQNCYYKQLKRKEQEFEELKSDLTDITKIIDCKNGTILSFKEKLDQLKEENEELKKANKHIEHNRNQKADKLMRIEKLITACSTGYTDEFIQELLVILHEPEPNSFENKYKTALTEIKEIVGIGLVDGLQPEEYSGFLKILQAQILQKISEVVKDE